MEKLNLVKGGGIRGKVKDAFDHLPYRAVALLGCFGIALGLDAILAYLCTNGTLPAEIGRSVCGG